MARAKSDLTDTERKLLERLRKGGGSASWALLSRVENACGTRLHKRGLCEWKLRYDAQSNEDRTLHITEAGRAALEEAK